MNVVRAVSSEGFGRIKHYSELRRRMDTDDEIQRYFDRTTTRLPSYYADRIREDLGSLWTWFPKGAMGHDQNAYLNAEPPLLALPAKRAPAATDAAA
jgi:hypothetical protein